MPWTRWAASLLALCVVAAAIVSISCSATSKPAAQTPVMSAEANIARGRVVAWTSGCNDCHTPGSMYGTPDTTRLLSGSELGWVGPWGTSYPPNLTPDSTTGIGNWTEEQIVTAIRQGHRPDGSPLLPPMPWPSMAQMSDDDVHALAAFLKSIPPISHEMPKAQPPGEKPARPAMFIPAPPAWDAQNLPPPPPAPTK